MASTIGVARDIAVTLVVIAGERSEVAGMLGVVALKLVVVDLAGAPPLLRVVAFVLIGTVMIAASWGYHRLK